MYFRGKYYKFEWQRFLFLCFRGKVCLPEAQQCSVRQQKSGSTTYQNKTYWFSWQSDEQARGEKGGWGGE